VADDLNQAKAKIREDMGLNAVILSTRNMVRPGFRGLLGQTCVEVTAAVDEAPPEIPEENAPSPATGSYEDLKKEIAETKQMIRDLSSLMEQRHIEPSYPSLLDQYYRHLRSQGVNRDIAQEWASRVMDELNVRELEDPERVWRALEKQVMALVNRYVQQDVPHSGHPRVTCLIGPTGVGKTTTIAKLAARANLFDKKRIALVTFDTYRIGAVDQLKTYGEILGVPVEVVFTPQELRAVISRCRGYDEIFVDTVGRSHNNQMQVSELKAFVEGAEPDTIHLVVSLTTQYDLLLDVVRAYSQVRPHSLLFTKMDEARSFGTIVNLVTETGLPFEFIANGQNVPDDLIAPDPTKVSQLIMGERPA
jgi:flagellar biosynthesis protein FlhF